MRTCGFKCRHILGRPFSLPTVSYSQSRLWAARSRYSTLQRAGSASSLPRLSAERTGSVSPATGGRIATVDQDCVVRIYDARGRLLARNEGFLMEPAAVDFTADGRHVIAGGVDRVSVYIDATNGKVSRRMDRDAEPAQFLYVSDDGRRFGVQFCKADNMLEPATVAAWDVESGRKVVEWTPPSVVLSIAWTPDGKLLASTTKKNELDVWRVL